MKQDQKDITNFSLIILKARRSGYKHRMNLLKGLFMEQDKKKPTRKVLRRLFTKIINPIFNHVTNNNKTKS